MRMAYDVIVIGAGPAGSIAARTTAQAGLSTLLIEKRQEIGSPVRCGEAVGYDTVQEFIPLDPKWISADIDSFSVHNPEGECVVVPPLEQTLILERRIFDRELARIAAEAGAEVLVKARATDLIRKDGRIAGVKMVVRGEPREVRSKIVIGAGGTESQSVRWAGLKSIPQLKNYYAAVQYLMTDIDVDPRICQYHVGWSIAPGGYCWVFPKGNRQANVGLVLTADPKGAKTAIQYLNEFVEKRFPTSSILAQIVGGIPITDVIPKMVTDGFMAAGDEAHQADPLHGGGIGASMNGGRFAGEVAVQAIETGDVSEMFLRKYEEKWEAKYGKMYRRLKRIRQAALKIPEEKMSRMIKMASQVETKDMTLMELFKIVLKSHPRMLLEVVPFFVGQ